MHAAKSWQVSYPASAIRLCRPYSLALEVSNFSAELRGDDFKAILRVLKSSYASLTHNKNSLILCTAFRWECNFKSTCFSQTGLSADDSQIRVELCRYRPAAFG